MIRVLLLGGSGQLGRCLRDRRPGDWELLAPESAQLDIRDRLAVDAAVARARPGLIVNAAAYNQVDQAESDPASARAVNADGPRFLAEAAARAGARLVHVSTDYVFDGLSGRPYTETDAARPLNAYGASKLLGEQAVLRALPTAVIVRTAWLYSEYGRNFVKTILDRARAGQALSVVDDQTGSPTYAGDLAQAIVGLGRLPDAGGGIYHYSGRDVLSWYAFARRIVQLAGCESASLTPRSSSSGHGVAARPRYSVLSCARIRSCGIAPRSVETGLAHTIQRLEQARGACLDVFTK